MLNVIFNQVQFHMCGVLCNGKVIIVKLLLLWRDHSHNYIFRHAILPCIFL